LNFLDIGTEMFAAAAKDSITTVKSCCQKQFCFTFVCLFKCEPFIVSDHKAIACCCRRRLLENRISSTKAVRMEKANECQEHRNEQQTTYTETDTHKSELIGNSLPLLLPSSNAFARR